MSWYHEYDDFFGGVTIDNRDLHYHADEEMPSLQAKFFMQDTEKDKTASLDFYIYKEGRKRYTQSNENITRLYQAQSLLVVPIEELQLEVEEHKKELLKLKNNAILEEKEPENALMKKQEIVKDKQLWVDKYMPKRFDELLSHHKINREVLCWLKAWDPIVFKKKIKPKKLSVGLPHYNNYGKNMFGQTHAQATSAGNQRQGGQTNSQQNHSGTTSKYPQGNQYNNNGQGFPQQRPFFYDLEDEYSLTKMQNSVILLAGPPGSGKTTLARIVAAHCGYKSIEINASEDRTAVKLIDRIETMTQNEALQFKAVQDQGQTDKPSLIIIDEVDGALESESQGAVNMLLDFIFKGEKFQPGKDKKAKQTTSNQKKKAEGKAQEKDEDDDDEDENNKIDDLNEEEKKKGSSIQSVHIRRPVIFICNDVYSKGLRELRKRALVFNFQKASSEKLMQRIKEICQKEKLYLDMPGLSKICDHNENDIRSTLMNLQMISKLQKQTNKQRISIDQVLLEEKNNSKSTLELMETVMMVSGQRNEPTIDIMRYAIHTLVKNAQPDILLDTSLINYTKIKTAERYFDRIPKFLKDLAFAEIIESNLLKYNYELGKFIAIPFINFGLHLKSTERTKMDYPRDGFILKKRAKAAIDCVESLLEKLPPADAPFISKTTFVLEYLSNLYQIIQPNIASKMNSELEKKALFTSLHIMIDFSLKLMDHPMKIDRNGQAFTVYFTPQIERMLAFGNTTFPDQSRMNERAIHFILKNYELVCHQKSLLTGLSEEEVQQKVQEQKLLNTQMLDNQYSKKVVKRKTRVEGEDLVFLYKFREGVSIPIKYDVRMDHFFS